MHLRADLDFQVALDGDSAEGITHGHVEADGTDVVVRFSRAPSFAGRSTRPLVGPLAERLARTGLTLYVADPVGPLLKLGAGVQAPRWQRLGTGSSRIQLHSVAAFRRTVGGPRLFEAALPTARSLPDLDALRRDPASRSTPTGPVERLQDALRWLGRRLTGRRRS